MCAHSDQIDRLAAFCRLAEKGYRRDPECGVLCEPEWVRDVPGGVEIWRPDESDDDCRVVLERFYEQTSSQQLSDFLDELANIAAEDHNRTKTWSEFLLLATPAEKCAAVLKVLGDA